MAIGLQQVDGLHVSKLLLQTALRNIKGEITMDEAQEIIRQHYENKQPQLLTETSEKTKKTSEKKQKTSEKIVELLRTNSNYSAVEMARILERTPRAIELQLEKLQKAGRLHRIGPDNGGYWEVID